MDWAAASAGLRNTRAEDTRKRQEMAKAFAEFRAANPYASAAEFQDFIDRYSGGRNYIAGGAPSGSILRAIGMENQKRKASDEMRQRLADIQTRQQTIQSLQKLADDALLNMEGNDFNAVRDEVIGQFGPDGANMLSGFNVNSMFTPNRKQVLVAEKMRSLLPGALDLAKSGLVKSSDITALYPGIEKSLIDPLVQEANRLRQKEMDDQAKEEALKIANTTTTLRSSLFQDPNFLSAVRSGDRAAAARIVNETVKPYTAVFPEGTFNQAFADGIIDSALQSAEQSQLLEHQKLYQDTETKRVEAVGKVEGDAMASVNMAFRASENGTPSTRAGGDALHNSNALFAAQKLATMFDTSQPGAVDALTGAFQRAADQGATIEGLTQLGAEALAAAGIPTLETSKQNAAMARGLNMPEMKSFTDWKVEIETDIREDFGIIDRGIQDVIMLTDPKAMHTEIANITRAIEQMRAAYGGVIQDARVNQNIWIPVGSEGWNDAQVFGKQGSVQATMDAEIAKLTQKLNALTQRAMTMEQQSQVAPQGNGFGPTPGSGAPAPSAVAPEGMTGAQELGSAIVNPQRGVAKLALAEARFALETGASGMPATAFLPEAMEFFTRPKDKNFSEDNALAERGISYLERPEAELWIMEDPARLQLLKTNPKAAIKELEAWFNKRNGNP